MLLNLLIIIVLLALSGTYAGLTLALFSLKLTALERKVKLGDERAKKVFAVRKKGNLLLCALLLGNVTSYSVMAIYLGSLTSGVIAGIVATSLIFIFGEILPQAVFPRYALQIGSSLYFLVWLTIIVYYPVAKPVAWLLDKILGAEPPVLWSKKELGEIISYHEHGGRGVIDKDEKRIILGALSFSDKEVAFSMIPKEDVFYLLAEDILNDQRLEDIRNQGFSRIPVCDSTETKVVGILYSKNLIGISGTEEIVAEQMVTKENVILVKENMKLDSLYQLLVERKTHMAIVEDMNEEFAGVITLEDVFEEILRMELEDRKY